MAAPDDNFSTAPERRRAQQWQVGSPCYYGLDRATFLGFIDSGGAVLNEAEIELYTGECRTVHLEVLSRSPMVLPTGRRDQAPDPADDVPGSPPAPASRWRSTP